MANETIFKPPYLNYGNPADLKKIKAQIAAFARREMLNGAPLSQSQAPQGNLLTPGVSVPARPDIKSAVLAPRHPGALALEEAGASPPPASMTTTGASAQKTLSTLGVFPSGIVPLGFNCLQDFTANLNYSASTIIWELLLKNQITGVFDDIYFMGGESSIKKVGININIIKFGHDFSTYRTAAYTSSNKTAIFAVRARSWYLGNAAGPWMSDEVTLDFSPKSCIGIHSMSLSKSSIVGSANDGEPTLTVTLDTPAGPGGQWVALSVNNGNLGNIMGAGGFLIPQGQTSGQLSWFLGTRQVLKDRTLMITAKLVSPTGRGPAHVSVTLTRN